MATNTIQPPPQLARIFKNQLAAELDRFLYLLWQIVRNIDGSVLALDTDLTDIHEHINNKSNPHETTAAQVSADPVGTCAAHATLTQTHGANGNIVGSNLAEINTAKIDLLKAGNVSAGNYTEFEADGTMVAHGNAATWDDMRIIPGAFVFAGLNDPTIVDWQPGGSGTTFKVYEFATSNQAFFTVQVPHGYKEGSNLSVHIHWTPGTRGNEEADKTVAWKLDYSWANIDGTFGVSATADMTDTCTGVDHAHLMTPAVDIPGTGKTISSMLVGRIYRDTGDSWVGTLSGQRPILLEIDFHFEQDTIGSRLVNTK